jgi:hypothetical protein
METATLFVVARSNKPNAFLATLFTHPLNDVASILQKQKFFYFYAIEKPAPAGMACSLAAAAEKEGIWRGPCAIWMAKIIALPGRHRYD